MPERTNVICPQEPESWLHFSSFESWNQWKQSGIASYWAEMGTKWPGACVPVPSHSCSISSSQWHLLLSILFKEIIMGKPDFSPTATGCPKYQPKRGHRRKSFLPLSKASNLVGIRWALNLKPLVLPWYGQKPFGHEPDWRLWLDTQTISAVVFFWLFLTALWLDTPITWNLWFFSLIRYPKFLNKENFFWSWITCKQY